jgi:hypothetical protein
MVYFINDYYRCDFKMTLCLINGLMNSGKTELSSFFAYLNYQLGFRVVSNYHLNFPHDEINRDYIFKLGKEQPKLNKVCFVFDELWSWLDCYDAKADKIASYFFLQSSKDDGNIYMTSQHFRQNNRRIKDNFHKLYDCERVLKIGEKFYRIDNSKRFLDMRLQDFLYIHIIEYENGKLDLIKKHEWNLKAKEFFTLYDTTQKIKR